jgi:hypothetical protein
MSTSPMGANKPIEDIEATLLFRKRPLLSGGKGVRSGRKRESGPSDTDRRLPVDWDLAVLISAHT